MTRCTDSDSFQPSYSLSSFLTFSLIHSLWETLDVITVCDVHLESYLSFLKIESSGPKPPSNSLGYLVFDQKPFNYIEIIDQFLYHLKSLGTCLKAVSCNMALKSLYIMQPPSTHPLITSSIHRRSSQWAIQRLFLKLSWFPMKNPIELYSHIKTVKCYDTGLMSKSFEGILWQ